MYRYRPQVRASAGPHSPVRRCAGDAMPASRRVTRAATRPSVRRWVRARNQTARATTAAITDAAGVTTFVAR